MSPTHASDNQDSASPAAGNQLAGEASPYLLQHADNPVSWQPWGDEAFARAKMEDKPIFLSIGYATCHWCHVMEHESFEDPEVAELMNSSFVNIKVDREERPDIDQVYMTVCQMMTGSGGWPLTIIMTPDKRPFFAATYIPKHSRHGRIGMMELIPKVRSLWTDRRADIDRSAEQIIGHLNSIGAPAKVGDTQTDVARIAFEQLAGRYDPSHGGFGSAPKFPSPHNLVFLTRYWRETDEQKALDMVTRTLDEMRQGGIFDHVGYGFHRYSTDGEWLVPHFEKMLYDQAMLVNAYSEAYLATGNGLYKRVVNEVLTYVLRDMISDEGGFYSAEDADSEGVEGKFYVWSAAELASILGDKDAAFAGALFNASEQGNFHDEASGERTGANILHLAGSLEASANGLDLSFEDFDLRLESVRGKLFDVRENRVRPLLDDKILADWNGLMIAAMARAGSVFDEARWVDAASRAADFVLDRMRDDDGRLLHRYHHGTVGVSAFLDDYAFLTWGLLELYDATLDPQRLRQAAALQDQSLSLFWDTENGGMYFTSADSEKLLIRQKEVYDGAIPSGNSVTMANLVRLNRLTGRSELVERAEALRLAFAGEVGRGPSAHCHLVGAIHSAASTGVEIVIAGRPGAADTQRLLETARSLYLPNAVILLVPPGKDGEAVKKLAPFSAGYEPVDGEAAAYVCRDFSCQLPTTDPAALLGMLEGKPAADDGGL